MRWLEVEAKGLGRAAALLLAAFVLTACAGSNVVADKSRRFDQATAAYDAGDYTTAYGIWSNLAAENDLAAMRNTAHMLRRGLGVDKNPGRALDLYTEAARKGLVLAMANVAEMHMNGEGTLKDPEEAARWYELAARGGLSIAMVRLAEMHDQGLGVKKDPQKAKALFEQASKNGFTPARERLGQPVEQVPAAPPQRVAEAPGAAPAMQPESMQRELAGPRKSMPVVDEQDRKSVGRSPRPQSAAIEPRTSPIQSAGFQSVPPVDQSAIAGLPEQDVQTLQAGWVAYQAGHMRDALKLWRSLADKGVPSAQIRVGAMFEQGLGVGRDLIEAYRWYRTAASRNDVQAAASVARVSAQMSPAERAIAESMAATPKDWPSKTR
jgi:TPR repeat protein